MPQYEEVVAPLHNPDQEPPNLLEGPVNLLEDDAPFYRTQIRGHLDTFL
jgi:hypothetical protein